jgi:hypothetical protein
MNATETKPALKRFDVLVSNGYRYEYETTIEARSVAEARKEWKRRGDWKSEDFKVRSEAVS